MTEARPVTVVGGRYCELHGVHAQLTVHDAMQAGLSRTITAILTLNALRELIGHLWRRAADGRNFTAVSVSAGEHTITLAADSITVAGEDDGPPVTVTVSLDDFQEIVGDAHQALIDTRVTEILN